MMRRVTILLIFVLTVSVLSCDLNLNQVNPNQLTTESYYQNGQQLGTAVAAVYANFHTTGMYKRRKFFIYDSLPGVVGPTGSAESWIPAMVNWNMNSTHSGLGLHWDALYQGIKRANLVIENAPDVTEGITESERQRYVAEARFLRGFFHYKLVSLWGGVPLLDEVKSEPGGEPRASAEDVYSFIESDLQFASDNLPATYGSSNIGRATSVAAQAIIGRMHLDRGNFGAAQNAFQAVINNGVAPDGDDLRLVDTYFNNFTEENENNDESIFEIQFAESSGGSAWAVQGGNGSNRTFRAQEYGFLQWRNVTASQSVMEEMNVQGTDRVEDIEDPRASSTFYFACDSYNSGETLYTTASHDCGTGLAPSERSTGDDIPSWKKYETYYRDARSGFVANSGINFREFRYAEVLLGLAEAHIQQGDINSAVDLMNQVRARVGLDGYNEGAGTVSSQQEAMDALYHEYVLEFTGESALLHALLRNPMYLTELNSNAPSSGPYLMPIPQSEIDNNPEISVDDQNPGY